MEHGRLVIMVEWIDVCYHWDVNLRILSANFLLDIDVSGGRKRVDCIFTFKMMKSPVEYKVKLVKSQGEEEAQVN